MNGVGEVWKEKRPPYQTKLATTTPELSETSSLVVADSEGSADSDSELAASFAELSGDVPPPSSTGIPLWLSGDDAEHASGRHAGTAEYVGVCTQLFGGLQRCQVNVDKFAAFDSGVLDYHHALLFSYRHKRSENRKSHGSPGTAVPCAAATGVAFSTCLIGTSCGQTASVSLSILIASASSTVTGGNLWRDSNAEHFTCNLATAGGTCTTPAFDGTCPIGTAPNGSGLCCFSSGTKTCSTALLSKCLMYGGDFDAFACTCSGCDFCGGSPIVIDVEGNGFALTNPAAGVDFDLNGNGTRDRSGLDSD